MYVVKRDGHREKVKFDKIVARIEKLCYGLDGNYVKPDEIALKVFHGLYDGVTTVELDNLSAETASTMVTKHPDFSMLAARIAISSLHKVTEKSFYNTMTRLYRHVDPKTGQNAPMISKATYKVIKENAAALEEEIIQDRDFSYDYFGFKTMEKSYLLKINGRIVERPQHMLMRVAVGIHGDDLKAVMETYKLLSEKWFTHATPTLFNAGTPKPQLSSCFLLTMKDDSIDGIYDTLKQTAKISQSAGGIGLAIHNIRAKGSYIKGTGGTSNGIVPMLRNFDMTARYVDQGGGKRKGAMAIYLEPWHSDVFEFLELKLNHGKEEMRARDLFYALWVPDLFMKRVEENGMWSLFSPDEAPGLSDCWGDEFERLYSKYEHENKFRIQVKAQALFEKIIECQIETGMPYMLYKDSANRKSNQKNLGTIRSSNLCTEIIEFSSPKEVAVCNLASISLPKFVINGKFDHQKLYEVTKVITRNLNKVIDINYYPVEEARYSNLRHRPIGIGVQGLADAYIILRYPFDSDDASRLNKDIAETIYFAAMEASMELAKQDGPYETFKGSPVSQGIFQFDMWNVTPDSGRWDWDALKENVRQHGVRNSLLVAPMPTASTSQILGNTECFEPITYNIYTRRVSSGEFIVCNSFLMKDLISLGMWNDTMRQRIIAAGGSIQSIPEIPTQLKEIYKTAYELSPKVLINQAVDRGAYICQSQSMNLFVTNPTVSKIASIHVYSWRKGLKTGLYYLRTESAAAPIQFTVDKNLVEEAQQLAVKQTTPVVATSVNIETELFKIGSTDQIACSLDDPEGCEMCGS